MQAFNRPIQPVRFYTRNGLNSKQQKKKSEKVIVRKSGLEFVVRSLKISVGKNRFYHESIKH